MAYVQRTWINSSVIVSTEKTGNTSTGTTLSTLKSIIDA